MARFAPGFCGLMPRPRGSGPGSWRRTALVRMLISIVLALGVCAFMIGVQGLNDRVFPADAAVVLGGGDEWAGADAAFGLYHYGTVKKIVLGGEAAVMRNYLVKHGVNPADIVQGPAAGGARAFAAFTAAYAREYGWERVIAVGRFFYLPRAVMAFKHEGLPVVGSLSAGGFEARDFFSLLHEIPAYFAYWSEIK